jgi:hypothetical protein
MAGITAPLNSQMKADAKTALTAAGITSGSYSARQLRHIVIQYLVSTGLTKNQAIASVTGQRWFTAGANVTDGVFDSPANALIDITSGLD